MDTRIFSEAPHVWSSMPHPATDSETLRKPNPDTHNPTGTKQYNRMYIGPHYTVDYELLSCAMIEDLRQCKIPTLKSLGAYCNMVNPGRYTINLPQHGVKWWRGRQQSVAMQRHRRPLQSKRDRSSSAKSKHAQEQAQQA